MVSLRKKATHWRAMGDKGGQDMSQMGTGRRRPGSSMEEFGPNVVENRKVPKVFRVGAQSKQDSRKRVL